jgi:hypothetical protein
MTTIKRETRNAKCSAGVPKKMADFEEIGDAGKWTDCHCKELDALTNTGTYVWYDGSNIPHARTVLPSHINYKIQYNADGTLNKFKARFRYFPSSQLIYSRQNGAKSIPMEKYMDNQLKKFKFNMEDFGASQSPLQWVLDPSDGPIF